jgi:hypothetical protein
LPKGYFRIQRVIFHASPSKIPKIAFIFKKRLYGSNLENNALAAIWSGNRYAGKCTDDLS